MNLCEIVKVYPCCYIPSVAVPMLGCGQPDRICEDLFELAGRHLVVGAPPLVFEMTLNTIDKKHPSLIHPQCR